MFKIVSLILIFYNKDEYYNGNLLIYYKKKKALRIPLGILIYLILITLRSFANLKIKSSMTQNNINQNTLFIIFGLIGTILYSIICIFSNFFTCKEIMGEDNDIDIFLIICAKLKMKLII